MSAIRSFLGKLPRPSGYFQCIGAKMRFLAYVAALAPVQGGALGAASCCQAVVGATAASAAAAGIWYLQQNTDKLAPAPAGKLGAEEAVKKEAQRPAEEAVANKAQPAGEEAATKET